MDNPTLMGVARSALGNLDKANQPVVFAPKLARDLVRRAVVVRQFG
jgi:hypothetical protein